MRAAQSAQLPKCHEANPHLNSFFRMATPWGSQAGLGNARPPLLTVELSVQISTDDPN